jgi:nitrate reductase gamma subunit
VRFWLGYACGVATIIGLILVVLYREAMLPPAPDGRSYQRRD